jgi:hypothetical protein
LAEKPRLQGRLGQAFEWTSNAGKDRNCPQVAHRVPADTEGRDVVDSSYSASELMFFDDAAGHQNYQNHPLHKEFIETCAHLWEKVIVYDSMDL